LVARTTRASGIIVMLNRSGNFPADLTELG
jgi:hypothetical protein